MLVLVGSQALKLRAPELLTRSPADVDMVGTLDEVQAFLRKVGEVQPFRSVYPINAGKKYVARDHPGMQIHEFEIAWSGSTAAQFQELVANDAETVIDTWAYGVQIMVPSLDFLYLLKRSHRYLKNSPHFLKTMRDLQTLEKAGYAVPEQYRDFFRAREKETYDYGHPKLNQGKMGFFSGDGVEYVFDHDSIHDAVAIGPRPAYTLYQKDGAEVECDRKKWDALPEELKLNGVLEESYVLALERSQIPFRDKVPPRKSFEMALMKVCTSITSGWFRAYAYDHYDQVVARYDAEYASKFWGRVAEGKVLKHGEKKAA